MDFKKRTILMNMAFAHGVEGVTFHYTDDAMLIWQGSQNFVTITHDRNVQSFKGLEHYQGNLTQVISNFLLNPKIWQGEKRIGGRKIYFTCTDDSFFMYVNEELDLLLDTIQDEKVYEKILGEALTDEYTARYALMGSIFCESGELQIERIEASLYIDKNTYVDISERVKQKLQKHNIPTSIPKEVVEFKKFLNSFPYEQKKNFLNML